MANLFFFEGGRKTSNLEIYRQTNDVLEDIKYMIDTSRQQAYQAVNTALVLRNWYIGKRIYEEEL